jgi:hypothetical protein
VVRAREDYSCETWDALSPCIFSLKRKTALSSRLSFSCIVIPGSQQRDERFAQWGLIDTGFVSAKGKFLDATQEMIALGVCNIFGSFVRSMPVTGSFTRTAVNHASAVKTPLGGIFTGT